MLFGATNVSVESLIGGRVEVMTATASNGAFDEVGVRVWDSSMVTITGQDTDAVEVRSGNFLM
jgi:hypothetical protein